MMVRLPVVGVISPDGRRSYWVAAVTPEKAMGAVARVIPEGHATRLLKHRLRVRPDALRPGQVQQLRL